MDYISVKEAATKFALSERRVQKLCETNRIEHCKRMSGVWLIPSNASKPFDERITRIPDNNEFLSLADICKELSISIATGKNWIKLGKLIPEYTDKKTPYFSKTYLDTFKNEIQSGKNTTLKSRRNKKFISGNSLYTSYVSDNSKNIPIIQELLRILDNQHIDLTIETIQLFLADCTLHLYSQKLNLNFQKETNLLLKYLTGEISVDKYSSLINTLISNPNNSIQFCKEYSSLFNIHYIYEPNEDILGLIYISCKNIGNRKATGSYYTPTQIVKKLISNLDIQANHRILDPCCGTGNFLLQLPNSHSFENIYGNDIDQTSVLITRINMTLKFPSVSLNDVYMHITHQNYLTEYSHTNFDYIIGNPPWGYDYNDTEKLDLKKLYQSAIGKSIESYDVFLECALRNLTSNGTLSYILPEAVLNVKSHTTIRNIILQNSSISYLEYLGNAFDGIQCPCIILQIKNTGTTLSTLGMKVKNLESSFTIMSERQVSSDYFNFTTTDEEYKILTKIKQLPNISYLEGNADFALGIVTGNNKDYISNTKNQHNEMILKGTDISKYHINPSDNYIVFAPENFQQTAPTEMYRAPEKLLYRFISNQLVFAYDNKQTLSLNSCNILIPKLPECNIKYILAILNSRVAQFFYKKEFNSIKVLRSHIENIPIPMVDSDIQSQIISLTETLISNRSLETAAMLYEQLDKMIFQAYNLSAIEQNIIKSAIDNDNKFLS